MRNNRASRKAADVVFATTTSLGDRVFGAVERAMRSTIDLATTLSYRADLYRSRQDLRSLSDEHLRDIGLTRRQAEREASRSFFPD